MSKKIIYILFFLLICSSVSLFSKGRSVIILNNCQSSTLHYLWGYKWGNQYKIDSVQSSPKGDIKFKTELSQGQYMISSGNSSILSFFVPESINYHFTFSKIDNNLIQKKGIKENAIYLEVQNTINNAKQRYSNIKELNTHLDSLYQQSELLPAPSYLGTLLGITLKKTSPENFPWNTDKFLNTQFITSSLNSYLIQIRGQKNSSIIESINEILLSNINTSNRELKSYLAWGVYNYFASSQIMGQEEIAIYIAENYFLNNKLSLSSNEALILMQNFIDFNKSSLIGRRAPNLILNDINNHEFNLLNLPNIPTILYFYTDNCSVCKVESPQLVDFVNEYQGGMLNVVAIYTDSNKQYWEKYVKDNFDSIYNPFINWVNVYDSDFSSNFQVLYNVIATPQMFLIDKYKNIKGRNLNTKSLKELIEITDARNSELSTLLSSFFNGLKTEKEVMSGIDYFYLKSSTDTLLLNDVIENLFTTLRMSDNYLLQNGAKYLADKYIIGNNSFNNYFKGEVEKWSTIYNMNPLGSKASNLLLQSPGGAEIWMNDIDGDFKVLYFYNIECGLCEQVTPKLLELYKEYKKNGIEFISINTGSDYTKWIKYIGSNNLDWVNLWGGENRSQIYENYYLESVPSIYLLKDNIVIAKDINDIDLSELLQLIKSTKYD